MESECKVVDDRLNLSIPYLYRNYNVETKEQSLVGPYNVLGIAKPYKGPPTEYILICASGAPSSQMWFVTLNQFRNEFVPVS